MIRTVAELLSEVVRAELPLLDASDIKHAPTIGDMYEGLSAELLARAIPEGLDLKVVTGFATDGAGNLSGQLDCMVVRGEGEPVPYTKAFVWHVKDIIAVIEVKKNLHSAEMADALEQLRSVKKLESDYRSNAGPQRVDIRPALTAFAETTRRVAPQDINELSTEDQLIFHTLVIEQVSIIRIALGLHGFKSELAFRKALVDILQVNIGVDGFSPGSFPQLIISGSYSLFKANGRPYSTRLTNGDEWPFYLSTPVNPLLLLLEFIWTQLDELFNMPDLWGEDMDLEIPRALLFAKGDPHGWHVRFVDPSKEELRAAPTTRPWEPAFVTLEEFVVLQQLSAGKKIAMDDEKLLSWLRQCDVKPETLRDNLLETSLVAIQGQELRLIARDCLCAILPTGEYVAAENNTGRLTRWIAKQYPSASNPT
ncbi:hypothetical protein GCM10022247_36140 [Allokutzneria multivorans]|uniref:DUF6602 domain-containing protein n=1 Tax=Allokutzneria multivorans TaxID=1142134 RepID=A0ABP7SEU7_9PSEU